MSDPSKYLGKPVRVACVDKRVVYGQLVCVSSPFSIILNHAVVHHPELLDLELEFHYVPQFPAKCFAPEGLADVYDKYAQATTPEEKALLEPQLDQAKAFNDEFMRDKYVIGSVVIPGDSIESVKLF